VFVFVIVLRIMGKEASVSLSDVSLSLLDSVYSSGSARSVLPTLRADPEERRLQLHRG
jgi:hypothetical protein